ESTTNCPTNPKENDKREKKENPYTSNKANENRTSDNLIPPRRSLDKENKNKENMKPNFRNNKEGANKRRQTQEDSVHSMLLQILSRLDKLEDQSSLFQTTFARRNKESEKEGESESPGEEVG
ncbi:26423_t:CDS:2, partial [Dentiscutata erythropus]